MIVGCGSCQSRFKVDPARIPAEGAKIRCPKCKGVIAVAPGQGTAQANAPAARPAPESRSPAPEAPWSPAPEAPRRFSPPEHHRASSTTVVVAHGNPAFGEQLRAFLERHDFTALGAADGAATEALVRERRPPLLLVDAALPGLPGHQLCERLKHDPATAGIKIVLVGAIYDRTRYRRPPQSLYGADGYVEKHQIADELVPMLRRLLEGGTVQAEEDQAEASQEPERLAPPEDYRASPAAASPAAASPAAASPAPATAAQRLARIIVSDIVLYNPDAVKRGLAEGNLAELLEDELRQGRDLLKDRLGPDAAARDYVLEALREYVQRVSARNAAASPR